ncbi:MAG: hypothetical protein ACXW1R_08690 [Halobacteriota archaeon]
MEVKSATAGALLLLLVVAVSATGCATSTTSQTPSPTVISQSASPTQTTSSAWWEHLPTNHGMRVAVSAMRLPTELSTQEPRPNHTFVAYNCTVLNINATDRPVDINYVMAQDTRGNSYTCGDVSNNLMTSPFKGSARSQPGDILGGVVVFEMPQDAAVLSLTYFDGSTRIVNTVLPV